MVIEGLQYFVQLHPMGTGPGTRVAVEVHDDRPATGEFRFKLPFFRWWFIRQRFRQTVPAKQSSKCHKKWTNVGYQTEMILYLPTKLQL